MTGRMESMENLTRDVAGFAKQRKVFHPSHRPLEIVTTIPTFPQPRLRRFSLANQKQGDISTRLTKGTFLFGLDITQSPPLRCAVQERYTAACVCQILEP
jgi:hypothetical protein